MDIYLQPNWQAGVRDTLIYLTTVFTSDDGHEQRSAERINARRTVELDALLTGKSLRDLKAILHSRSDFICYVPEPVQVLSKVAVYAPLGSTSIQFEDAIPASQVGRRVCVQGWKRYFFAEVASVSGNTVTFADPIEAEARVGENLRACMVGHLPTSVTLNHVTDDVAVFPATFLQLPGEKNAGYGTAPFTTFSGREVLTEKPNWTQPPSIEVIGDYEVTDFQRGIIKTYSPIDFVTKITQFTFMGRSTAKMNRLIDFFHRQMGRLNEFWCPSWTSDLKLAQSISNGSSSIVVEGCAASDHYADSTVETAIAIRLPGDVWRFRKIAGITTNGTTSTITLTSTINLDVELGSEIGIYWLNVCRFATDAVTIQWITDEVAQTVFQITTLEALPAES
ncbi:minor tail protein [Rhodobacter phage RcCWillis]|nr:minor tail protein [Rhodobacter phage RcCWillis]